MQIIVYKEVDMIDFTTMMVEWVLIFERFVVKNTSLQNIKYSSRVVKSYKSLGKHT